MGAQGFMPAQGFPDVDAAAGAGLNSAITNGLLTVNTSGISINLSALLTTAAVSNAVVLTSAGLNLTSISATFNSNSISLSVGPYITTGALSNGVVLSNAGLNLTSISATLASNSISLSVGPYITTGMLSNAGVLTNAGLNLTSISATLASNSISLSVGAYITTAMLSNRGSDFVAATAGFNGTNCSGTIASNSLSVNAAAQTTVISSFVPNLMALGSTTTMTWNGASVSHAMAFNLPYPASFSFIRIPVTISTNSTSLGTTAQAATSFQMGVFSTYNAVVYSMAGAGNSKSLTSVASGSAGFTISNKISISNTTQVSFSDALTYQIEGAQTSSSSQWSVSQTRIDLVTTNWQSKFTGLQFIDINFANSLPQGAYWLVVGMSTSSSTNNASYAAGTNAYVAYSNHYGIAQANSYWSPFGSAGSTTGGLLGAGSFSTGGGGTTAAFHISAISSSAGNNIPYIQMLRSA